MESDCVFNPHRSAGVHDFRSITIGRWVATTSFSITRDGDAVTIVASHEGSRFGGLTMSTQATQVITGKTLATTFQNMSIDGVRTKMSWSEGTQTIKRIK